MQEPLPLTHVAYHILLALTRRDRHGYGVIQDVALSTDGQVELQAGTLYAALKRLVDEGWIEPVAAPAGADTRRRTYAITNRGREILLAESRRLERMVELAREASVLPGVRSAEA